MADQVFPKGITGDFFDKILEKKVFLEEIHDDFFNRSAERGVEPHWNHRNAQEAYFEWSQDLKRLEFIESEIEKADHLKCAAHLIFWLRRSSPINDFAYDLPLDAGKEFMIKYGREYLAFDIGYRAAQLYERKINGRELPENSFSLESTLPGVLHNDFVETAAHVMKLKMISPHGILLILKAIFLRP